MVIYGIKCIITNKYYIGLTNSFYVRKRTHLQHLTRDNHHSSKLQRAWNKYGSENFTFEILKKVKDENIFELEIEYIKKFNSFKNGYNCTIGGEGLHGRFGINHHHSRYYFIYDINGNYLTKRLTIKKIEQYTGKSVRFGKKEFVISNNFVITKKNYGKKFIGHHKILKYDFNNILVDSFLSTKYITDYEIKNIYLSSRLNKTIDGFKWVIKKSENVITQHKSLEKSIKMLNMNGELLKIFDSLTLAYDFINVPVNGNVTKCLKGKQHSAYGYKWIYVTKE